MTTIHEMNQVIWVTNEKLGDGIIIAIIDYGPHHNSVLMVGFESGEIKFLDTNQVRLTRNDTLGIASTGPARAERPDQIDFSKYDELGGYGLKKPPVINPSAVGI